MTDVEPARTVIEYANPCAGQPFDSRTRFEQHPDGISYAFLPEGAGGAARGLAVIGLAALAMHLFPILVLVRAVTWEEIGWHERWLRWAPSVAVIPLAVLAAAMIRSAGRPTVLGVRGGRVMLFSGAALFRPVISWPVNDIESVSVNVRGISARLHVSADLNLRLRDGRTVLVIAGRDRADLEWVANGLRAALSHTG